MFIQIIVTFLLIGLVGGLFGVFYRNCLKVENMIFNPIYTKVFEPWMKGTNKFLAWIAMPLGGCIYCSTFWITMLLSILFLTSFDTLPKWQYLIIGVIAAEGVQHLVVCIACRWLIANHPDLDNN